MGSTKFRTILFFLLLGAASGQVRVSPFMYNVHLHELQPDIHTFTATSAAFVFISGVASTGEETVTLEAENFSVTSLQVRNITGATPENLYPSVHWKNQTTYSIKLMLDPYTTKLEIVMKYSGRIYHPGQKGLFVTYDRKMVATDLYPDGARRVFPCIQDPQFKTKFTLTLDEVPKDWNYIINNFPVNSGNKMTPPLPTFGVGLIAGENLKVNPVWEYSPISYSGPRSDVIKKVLSDPFFQNMSYTVPGGISVVVVHGLSQVSSASYGLVFLSKEIFANDGQLTGAAEMHGQIMATLNGLGKHFLRNVVTPVSWSEHWLSDSLTLYLQYRIAENILNSSSIGGAEVVRTSLTNGNPSVVDPTVNINTMTSSAIYPSVYKGASLLMMLNDIMETDIAFSIGLFVLNKTGETVTTNDFLPWLFPDKKPEDINSILSQWIYQNDFPCVTVQRTNVSYVLSQTDCWQKGKPGTWWIPVAWKNINFTGNSTPDKNLWLQPNKQAMLSGNSTSFNNSYLSINPFGNGLYRQIYINDTMLERLLQVDLSDGDKAAKLDDAFNLAWTLSSSKPLTLFLDSLSSLSSNDGYATWKSAINAITTMTRAYYSTDIEAPLKARLGQVISEAYTDVASWVWSRNYEVDVVQRMRASDLVKAACWMDVSTCRMDALNAAISGANNPDVWSELMCSIISNSNSTQIWNTLLQQYQPKGNQYRRSALLNALTCVSPGSAIINEFLNLILLDNAFPDDISVAFEAIYDKPEHAMEAVNYLTDNAVHIKDVLHYETMRNLIIQIGRKLTTSEQIQQLVNVRTTFMGEPLEEAANEAINSATETLQISSLHDSEVRQWLGKPAHTTVTTTASTVTGSTDNPNTNNGSAVGIYGSAFITGSALLVLHLLT